MHDCFLPSVCVTPCSKYKKVCLLMAIEEKLRSQKFTFILR